MNISMHNPVLKSLLTVALVCQPLISESSSIASLTLAVTLQPDSCDITLSNASIPLGNIPATALSDKINLIKPVSAVVSVTCNAATAMAIRTADNRSASAYTLNEFASDTHAASLPADDDTVLYGLGHDNKSRKIGVLFLGISAVTHDVQNGILVYSTNKSTWINRTVSASDPWFIPWNSYFSVASRADSTSPVSLTQATFTVQPVIYLKNSAQYSGGEQVNIDGNITFSVIYL